ncbi:hypothetical protein [Phocaeicola sp.]
MKIQPCRHDSFLLHDGKHQRMLIFAFIWSENTEKCRGYGNAVYMQVMGHYAMNQNVMIMKK